MLPTNVSELTTPYAQNEVAGPTRRNSTTFPATRRASACSEIINSDEDFDNLSTQGCPASAHPSLNFDIDDLDTSCSAGRRTSAYSSTNFANTEANFAAQAYPTNTNSMHRSLPASIDFMEKLVKKAYPSLAIKTPARTSPLVHPSNSELQPTPEETILEFNKWLQNPRHFTLRQNLKNQYFLDSTFNDGSEKIWLKNNTTIDNGLDRCIRHFFLYYKKNKDKKNSSELIKEFPEKNPKIPQLAFQNYPAYAKIIINHYKKLLSEKDDLASTVA